MRLLKSRLIAFLLAIVLTSSMVGFNFSTVEAWSTPENDYSLIVVSLGDSFASGEGIENFIGQKDENGREKSLQKKAENESWLAHRSEKSWAGKLYIEGRMPEGKTLNDYNVDAGKASDTDKIRWYFRASSGATTEHFIGSVDDKNTEGVQRKNVYDNKGNYVGGKDLPKQLSVFSEKKLKGKVDYVTVSIGGNDVMFSDIIKQCVVEPSYVTRSTLLSVFLNKIWEAIGPIGGRIKRTYQAIQKEAGEQATIIVTGYPKLLDYNGDGGLFSAKEAELINTAVTKFNYVLHRIVEECQNDGMNIVFVDVEAQFDKGSHAAYSKEPWINKVYLGEIKPQDLNQHFGVDNLASSYSMHPNDKGTDAYRDCVTEAIKWTYDSNFHWHQCSGHKVDIEKLVSVPITTSLNNFLFGKSYYYGGACEKPVCKTPHTYGEWIIKTAATTTSEGTKSRVCTVCGFEQKETIPKVPANHVHEWASVWSNNEIAHWHNCSGCEEKGNYGGHDWSPWVTVKEATESESGQRKRNCTICGFLVVEDTSTLPHTHRWATAWEYDETAHWHECEGCLERSGYAEHDWTQWAILDEATEYEGGQRYRNCKVCGFCDIEETPPIAHAHSWSLEWSYDDAVHWNGCESCDEKNNLSSHVFGEWTIVENPTSTKNGVKVRTCIDCGYQQEGVVFNRLTTRTINCTFDSLIIDGVINFNLGDGDASYALDRYNRIVNGEDGNVKLIRYRGWACYEDEIDAFGYQINDGEPVFGDFWETLDGEGLGTNARRFDITIDVTNLRGSNSINVVVRLVNGEITRIDENSYNQWGHSPNTVLTYNGPLQ